MNSKPTVIDTITSIDIISDKSIATVCGENSAIDHSQQHYFFNQNHDDMSKTEQQTTSICEHANQRIIKLLEQGNVAWRRTWGSYGLARNYSTGHVYGGINIFFLNLLSPHPIPYYLTFRQVQKLGGKIRKGAKSEKVYFYKNYYKDADGNSIAEKDLGLPKYQNQEIMSIRFLRCYSVFNIEDTEGIEWEKPAGLNRPNIPIEECELILQEMEEPPMFNLVDANQAFYDPEADQINVPDIRQFENATFFYRTTFHEVAHWTGHKNRLARKGVVEKIDRSSDRYAEEELIAELTSNYLMSIAGVATDDTQQVSAGYIKCWIERLKADPKMIFRIAPQAQKAVEYILGKALSKLEI